MKVLSSSIDAFIDRMLTAIVTRSSGRTITVIVLALWGGVGLALPLVLGWQVQYLVLANLFGTELAVLLLLMWIVRWLVDRMNARDRRHLLEWTTNLRLLTSEEFEWLVGEMFRREGWTVRETGRQDGPDGNIDLELMRDGQRMIVQCKRWESWLVPVDEIRKFAGTLMREGLAGEAGTFVTLSGFGTQATAEAQQTGITLVGRDDLYTRIERVRRAEPCPVCAAPMILDRSQRGWWLRCVASGCAGKRDLGSEPGRAVEFLTTEQDTPAAR